MKFIVFIFSFFSIAIFTRILPLFFANFYDASKLLYYLVYILNPIGLFFLFKYTLNRVYANFIFLILFEIFIFQTISSLSILLMIQDFTSFYTLEFFLIFLSLPILLFLYNKKIKLVIHRNEMSGIVKFFYFISIFIGSFWSLMSGTVYKDVLIENYSQEIEAKVIYVNNQPAPNYSGIKYSYQIEDSIFFGEESMKSTNYPYKESDSVKILYSKKNKKFSKLLSRKSVSPI